MNVCTEPNSEVMLNRYVQGTLSEIDARHFEEHFFECTSCLVQVEALQTIARKLAADRVPLPGRLVVKKEFVWPYRMLGAIAAMLVVACLIALLARRTNHSASQTAAALPATVSKPAVTAKPATGFAALADFSMPPFEPAHLRGVSSNADFVAGMQAYSRRDCQGALAALTHVSSDDSASTAARFYTGICQMQERDLGAAYGSLGRVAYAVDTPQQEAAFYYLAQVEIARGDARSAQADLVQTVILHGEFERRARTELNQIRTPQSAPAAAATP